MPSQVSEGKLKKMIGGNYSVNGGGVSASQFVFLLLFVRYGHPFNMFSFQMDPILKGEK